MVLSAKAIIFTFIIISRANNDVTYTRMSNFASVYKFVVELRNTCETTIEYVAMIQAMFCPEQPICDGGSEQERSEILRKLPEYILVGESYIKIEDIHEALGVCCLSCSCSESCQQDSNCCPSKAITLNVTSHWDPVLVECITAIPDSYESKTGHKSAHTSYFMTTRCYGNQYNASLVESCEIPSVDHLDDSVPVTSVKTGRTYWNKHCALCNNDAQIIEQWDVFINFEFEHIFFGNNTHSGVYPQTLEELYKLLVKVSDINFVPPFSMENKRCYRRDTAIQFCNTSPENNNSLDCHFIFEACQQFYHPVTVTVSTFGRQIPFMNIFCFFCYASSLEIRREQTVCGVTDAMKSMIGGMSAFLDYRQNTESEDPVTNGQYQLERKCRCNEVEDIYLDECRPMFCPVGEFLVGCQCLQPLKKLSGMPVLLNLKVVPKSDQGDHLSGEQSNNYTAALLEALLEAVEHITVEIFATFKQETDAKYHYLSIVIVRTKPGHGIGNTMKPFMKYLDKPEQLEFRLAETTYGVNVISGVELWYDAASKSVKAREIDIIAPDPTPVFISSKFTSYIARNYYQTFSPLLYCYQIQLNDTEFIEKEGRITVTTTSPTFTVPHYYRVGSKARVCVAHYLQERNNVAPAAYSVLIYMYITILSANNVA